MGKRMEMIEKFLEAYSEYLGWKKMPKEAIMRKLCENYDYSPRSREFLMIAFGWMWGQSTETMPFIHANCNCALLELELNQVYNVVAKENHWD